MGAAAEPDAVEPGVVGLDVVGPVVAEPAGVAPAVMFGTLERAQVDMPAAHQVAATQHTPVHIQEEPALANLEVALAAATPDWCVAAAVVVELGRGYRAVLAPVVRTAAPLSSLSAPASHLVAVGWVSVALAVWAHAARRGRQWKGAAALCAPNSAAAMASLAPAMRSSRRSWST